MQSRRRETEETLAEFSFRQAVSSKAISCSKFVAFFFIQKADPCVG